LSGHKGTFGKAMIASGGANYTGAPYLSAAAATRVGAGLVTLATTREVQRIVASNLHEPTYLPLPSAAGNIAAGAARVVRAALAGYNALLVGPGLGRASSTQTFVYRLLGLTARPGAGRRPAKSSSTAHPLPRLIVDADGLNALSERDRWWEHLPPQSVLTPHVGEFGRLSKLPGTEINSDRIGCVRRFAQQWNQVVLLKGAFTVIAQPDGLVTILPFANPALATAGSGDVLSGIIVGLMAQGLTPRDAAIAGGYIHGAAGELSRREIGDAGALAGDLLPRIPRALVALKS
jgi:NAD(P)H-hydrate epimerase